jgi:hypothetical protein
MKTSAAAVLSLAATATAHYNFPSLIYGGVTTTAWEYVRQWTDYYAYTPVQTVSTTDIRCNVGGTTSGATTSTLTVSAGQTLGFTVGPDIYHPGPLLAYMAKVPSGETASSWDGSGSVWFKIFEQGPEASSYGTEALVWPTNDPDATTVTFTLPSALPSGEYLFRVEHIALHVATSEGGAQFYLSCAQVNVINGGSGSPSPLVAFPGAYSATDPGILIDIYYPVPTNYTIPGPAVWT